MALGAWIRKADILARLGRYNESLEAFDGALRLLPTEDRATTLNCGMRTPPSATVPGWQTARSPLSN